MRTLVFRLGFLLLPRKRQSHGLRRALRRSTANGGASVLPFGTKLWVSRGGRSVMVTVNDRGPFVRGRVLDLALAPARELGLVGLGVAHVDAAVVE
jgi:rare lipoprotein A